MFVTSLITFLKNHEFNLKFVTSLRSTGLFSLLPTKIYREFIVPTLCTVGSNVRFLLSSKGLELINMRKCHSLHNPEICIVSMSPTFTLKKYRFCSNCAVLYMKKTSFLTAKTVHNFRAKLVMIAHYLIWSEN